MTQLNNSCNQITTNNSIITSSNANSGTALGYEAMTNNTGTNNVAIGYQSFAATGSGAHTTSVGYQALQHMTSGINDAFGYQALQTNTTGTVNVAIGYLTLQANTTGTQNTAVGNAALTANVGGQGNTAVGMSSLTANTSGIYNTAVGWESLTSNQGANFNAAFGVEAGSGLTSGSNNTACGYFALRSVATGTDNVALGSEAALNYTGAESNNICIGAGVEGTLGESNILRIGTGMSECYISGISGVAGVAGNTPQVMLCDGGGHLSTIASSTAGFVLTSNGNSAAAPSFQANTAASFSTGTFTPVLTFGGTPTAATYTSQQGKYTEIANVVYFDIYVALSTAPTESGVAAFSGLPVLSNASQQAMISMTSSGITYTTGYSYLFGIITLSVTTIDIIQSGSNVTQATITSSAFSTTTNLQVSGFYFTS